MASPFVAPAITNIDLAPDDAIWLIEADIDCLKMILANPGGFVRTHVKVNDKPAVLCEPFVVMFQPMPSCDGSQKIYVQGISGTAMLKVRYTVTGKSDFAAKQVLPKNEPHCILKHGSQVYSHLELRDMDPEQVAESIIKGILCLDEYFEELNELPQVINGVELAPGERGLTFRSLGIHETRFIYQGWSAPAGYFAGMKDGDPPPSPGPSPSPSPVCDNTDGDADEEGNVWVNGVIVKTYTMTEPEEKKN